MSTKIGFILLSKTSNPLPSTRISVLNMLPYLKAAGYDPVISFEPEVSTENPELSGLSHRMAKEGIKLAYFQKVHGASVIETVKELHVMGVKTIYGVCDLIDNQMTEFTNVTIAVTDFLKSLYYPKYQDKIYVVHDGIEKPELYKREYRSDNGNGKRPLRSVLVTSGHLYRIPVFKKPPKFIEIRVIGNYPPYSFLHSLKRRYWDIAAEPSWGKRIDRGRFLIGNRFKRINWHANTVYDHMLGSDIGIIPIERNLDFSDYNSIPGWALKSENRLTMKMAAGLPVIATPIPSYEKIIVHGENGYIANNEEEWLQCFEELRDPDKRESIGKRARESVINRFSKEEQARKLVQILNNMRL